MDAEQTTAAEDQQHPGPGHNWRPWAEVTPGDDHLSADLDLLREILRNRWESLRRRRDEILDQIADFPEAIGIDDADAFDEAQNIIKAARTLWSELDKQRENWRQSARDIADCIQNVFKEHQDPIARDTKEGNGKTNAIPSIQRKINEHDALVEARARAEREAEARAREAEARRQREEADRLRREEEAAKAAAARKRNEEARVAAAAEAEEKERLRREADRAAHEREAEAIAARTAAEAPAAELTRTRSTYGAVSSRVTIWRCDPRSIDRPRLDLETLRPHFTANCLEQAIGSFVRGGGRELRGARIYEDKTTRVR